jgi:hypothetical protein
MLLLNPLTHFKIFLHIRCMNIKIQAPNVAILLMIAIASTMNNIATLMVYIKFYDVLTDKFHVVQSLQQHEIQPGDTLPYAD